MSNETQEALDNIWRRLTTKQKAFLEARKETETDYEASDIAGIAQSTASRWKNDKPFFLEAYELVVGASTPEQLVIADRKLEDIRGKQVEMLEGILPSVIQEHIDLALGAQSENVRLSAIKEIYDILGLRRDSTAGEDLKGREKFMQYIQIFAPQMAAINAGEEEGEINTIEAEYWDIDERGE